MDSRITQVISERIDQPRPVLFLIGQGQHFRAQQEIDHIAACLSIPSQARIGSLVDILVRHIAMQLGIQPRQISMYRLRLLPLFEYHYPHLVPHPRAKIVSQPYLHAADSEVVYPPS